MFRQESATDIIEFGGRHAGLHLRLHFAQGQGNDVTDSLQVSQVFFVFDCHVIILLHLEVWLNGGSPYLPLSFYFKQLP
jgi:hypothetical protein